MMILTNVTFGLWCFGATNAWLKNGYLWIKNDIFELKWSEFYKKTKNGYSREKKLYSTMLCGLLFGFDTILTEIKKREKITSATRLRDDNFCVKSSTPSFADQKSVQKSISSRNREIFEFKWERNWLSKNLDPALYRVGFDIMFKNI